MIRLLRTIRDIGVIRTIKYRHMVRQGNKLRQEWIAAGEPSEGPLRDAMIRHFVHEGMYRYRKALDRLADE